MLIYVGQGNFLPGIPARDLTAGEVEQCGGEAALLATGLYVKLPKVQEPKKEDFAQIEHLAQNKRAFDDRK